jgi:hypothetical protein
MLDQRKEGHEAIKSLEIAFKVTQLMLEENPADTLYESTKNPSEINNAKRPLKLLLYVPKANLRSVRRPALIGSIEDAAREIHACQQSNERAFKLVWKLYVITQQHTGRRLPIDSVSNIQVGKVVDSDLHSFHLHPFALSP